MSLVTRQQAFENWLGRAEERPAIWLAVAALVLTLQICPFWYPAPDGAAYLSIARSIAAGGPMARFGSAELSYPLGYPLLISPAFHIAARPFLALAMMNWVMAVIFMLGVYVWARRELGGGALWVTALVMANVSVWTVYRQTLSEAAFLALMIWTVNALNGLLADGEPSAQGNQPGGASQVGRRRIVAVGRLLAIAALLIGLTAIREAGVLFGAGFLLALLVRALRGTANRRATAAAVIVTSVALFVALSSIRPERIAAAGPAIAGNLAGYGDADGAVTSLDRRVLLRLMEMGQLLVPGMFRTYGRSWLDINTAVYALVLAAVLIGWWSIVRRRSDVLALTAPLYVAMYMIWPYAAGTRYFVPLLPLFVACIWIFLALFRGWRLSIVAAALVAHVGVAAGHWILVDRPAARTCDRLWPTVDFLAAHTAAAGAIAAVPVPVCLTPMLALALDRPVRQASATAAVDADVEWIVAPERAEPQAGFRPAAAAGDYVLLRRAH